MITELSNYVDSLGDKLNWLLFESRNLEEGDYFIFDVDSSDKNIFKLITEFKVSNDGNITSLQDSAFIYNKISEFEFFKKFFYSRIVSTNKAMKTPDCKMITSNNPALIFFNIEKLPGVPKCISPFVEACLAFHKTTIEKFGRTELITEFKVSVEIIISELIQSEQISKKGKMFFFLNLPSEEFEEFSDGYHKEMIFLEEVTKSRYGVSSFKMVGKSKKPYTWSRTSNIKLPGFVNYQTALNLNTLSYIFRYSRAFIPSPLPIYIYKEQLNSEIINLIKENGKSLFREVFQILYSGHKWDLNNYYLLSWNYSKDGLEIFDFDFVEKFIYEVRDFDIFPLVQNLYYTFDKLKLIQINNIFDFETEVICPVFNNILVKKFKDSLSLNYFSDFSKSLDDESKKFKLTILNTHLYRFPVYEFIYKSKLSVLTERTLYHVILDSIYDLIHSLEIPLKNADQDKRIKKHSKRIIHLLNILFSLNHKFDKNNTNFGGRYMPSEIPKYFERIGEIVNSSEYHIHDDYEYAFCAGQLIYYLLSQSQSGNKTHSLLEPFINRTTVESFNDQLIRVFNQYKHAISFNSRRFNRLFEEVIGYRPETGYKEMLPVLFAGYFGENILYKSNETLEETN